MNRSRDSNILHNIVITKDDKKALVEAHKFSENELKILAKVPCYVDLKINNCCYRYEKRAKHTFANKNVEFKPEHIAKIYKTFKVKKKFNDYYYNFYRRNEEIMRKTRHDYLLERKYSSLVHLTLLEDSMPNEHETEGESTSAESFETVINTQNSPTKITQEVNELVLNYDDLDASTEDIATSKVPQDDIVFPVESEQMDSYSQFQRCAGVTSTQQQVYEISDGTESAH